MARQRKSPKQLQEQTQRLYDENGRRYANGQISEARFWAGVDRITRASDKVENNMINAGIARGLTRMVNVGGMNLPQTSSRFNQAKFSAAERQGKKAASVG